MALYDRLSAFDATVFRNIASLRRSADLFDDLVEDDAGLAAATAADIRVRPVPPGIIPRGFHYSQAIGYPFTSDRTLASRYGDGSVRVWYGALEEATALAETCWHQIRQLRAIEGVETPVVRYRAVYGVRANGLFLDLCDKAGEHPELLSDDYAATQAIGRHIAAQGLPGLIYPAARWPAGRCLAAFRAEVLSEPRLRYYLTYRIDPVAGEVRVERKPGRTWRRLRLTDLRHDALAGG